MYALFTQINDSNWQWKLKIVDYVFNTCDNSFELFVTSRAVFINYWWGVINMIRKAGFLVYFSTNFNVFIVVLDNNWFLFTFQIVNV